jgi:hypothetical protein
MKGAHRTLTAAKLVVRGCGTHNARVAKRIITRFAVHDAGTGMVSPPWTVTIRGGDIYIFSRGLGHIVKGTIHSQTGQCHIKYDKVFAERNQQVLPRWIVDKWTYEKVGPWVEPFRIAVPVNTIDTLLSSLPANKKFQLIPVANDGRATIFRFAIVAPTTEIVRDPILMHTLPDGSIFCLDASYADLPNIQFPKQTPVRYFSGKSPDSIAPNDKLRGIVLGDYGGTRCLFDVAIQYTPKSD